VAPAGKGGLITPTFRRSSVNSFAEIVSHEDRGAALRQDAASRQVQDAAAFHISSHLLCEGGWEYLVPSVHYWYSIPGAGTYLKKNRLPLERNSKPQS
jgi:hypothetical protein